ncbi:mannitol-1-phosphate 5-dehydrogenase [Clostridium intestinale]|uniref:Mannitol-1-phosphate 5-dehydrogenase n=2 Tax=Clostridium intestinale TaxID=36845 RepID=U2PRS3_9CLOT|nr:mannitol-1-phosphate 5-dehydrogenase [Clostridium intestinale]ERK29140.1 mannitol-1-phosphate 5-dehydrogenase [Clostridium intestinale URNW]QLY80515.1 mannitol-1-phosphate 5-dehydrogenase [Clostridium intestinale]
MKAIQIGAGNIGRGFIGELLAHSGFEVTFVDANNTVVELINELKNYTVHVLDNEKRDEKVENVSALNINDEKLMDAILEADIMTTAVGVNILSRIAETLAKGIKNRLAKGVEKNLNIIACENAVGASEVLKEEIFKYLTEEEKETVDKYVGFPNSSVDRIVPPVSEKMENPLDVVVENYYEWNVDRNGFRGEIPEINGMNLTGNLIAYVERKLFTLNTGHAITAYLGNLKGYKTIEESINDNDIYEVVYHAMVESGDGLVKKYDFDRDAHLKYIDKIIARFKNPYLQDDIKRVGREPIRKLSKGDRLVKPLLNSMSYGISTENLLLGVGAVLYYNNPEDPQSLKLQELIKEKGIKGAVQEVSEISDENILNNIESKYEQVRELFK